jgi:hypothetical protein
MELCCGGSTAALSQQDRQLHASAVADVRLGQVRLSVLFAVHRDVLALPVLATVTILWIGGAALIPRAAVAPAMGSPCEPT